MEIPFIVNISYRGQPILKLCKPIDIDLAPYKSNETPEQKVTLIYGVMACAPTALQAPKIVFIDKLKSELWFDLEKLVERRVTRKQLESYVEKMILDFICYNWVVDQEDFIKLVSKSSLLGLVAKSVKGLIPFKRSPQRI